MFASSGPTSTRWLFLCTSNSSNQCLALIVTHDAEEDYVQPGVDGIVVIVTLFNLKRPSNPHRFLRLHFSERLINVYL